MKHFMPLNKEEKDILVDTLSALGLKRGFI